MLKIYHTEKHALVADEELKVYWYETIEDARTIAKTVASVTYPRRNLANQSEFLQSIGCVETKVESMKRKY